MLPAGAGKLPRVLRMLGAQGTQASRLATEPRRLSLVPTCNFLSKRHRLSLEAAERPFNSAFISCRLSVA
jgi:hypothetical protein